MEQPGLFTGLLKALVHQEAAVLDITEYSKAFHVSHNALMMVRRIITTCSWVQLFKELAISRVFFNVKMSTLTE